MSRSEERLHFGVERHRSGLALLRKYVVSERVEGTVPVRREELVVEREPVSDADAARLAATELSEEEHVIVLHEEQAVTRKEIVPVERVRLGVQEVTEEQVVTDRVRRERIDLETDPGVGTPRERA